MKYSYCVNHKNKYETVEALYTMLLSKKTTRMQPTLKPIMDSYRLLSKYISACGFSQPRYIQILGTNGKGSTSVYIANLALAHGVSIGLFTSPHLVNIRERIVIDGAMCTEEEWIEASEIIEDVCNTKDLLFFEYILLVAIYIFSYKNVEIAIMEAGLGGVYDATSIVEHCLQCFTPIQLDHEHILGKTHVEIAHQKAGAIQQKSSVFSAPQREDVRDVLLQYALQGISFSYDTPYYHLSLKGEHQHINANLAYLVWEHLCKILSLTMVDEYVEQAYRDSYIAGRIEHITMSNGVVVLLDGAHNCGGLESLYRYCQEREIRGVIYSTVYRESISETTQWVRKIARDSPIYYTTMNTPRAIPYKSIKEYDNSYIACTSIQEGLNNLYNVKRQGDIVICGSLYLVSDFFAEFPEYYRFRIKNI